MFEKGVSGNALGRKVGSQNKCTVRIREAITNFIDTYISKGRFSKDIDMLNEKDRVKAITDLIQFAIPKLQSMSVDSTIVKRSDFSEELKKLSEATAKLSTEKKESN